MLGELAQLVRVGAVVPRRREGDERDALRRGLLGRRCERGEGDEAAQRRRHGVRLLERLCREMLCTAVRGQGAKASCVCSLGQALGSSWLRIPPVVAWRRLGKVLWLRC